MKAFMLKVVSHMVLFYTNSVEQQERDPVIFSFTVSFFHNSVNLEEDAVLLLVHLSSDGGHSSHCTHSMIAIKAQVQKIILTDICQIF